MPFFGVPIRNGLPIGLGSVAGFGVQQFDPSQLFAGGTVAGAWYDPSDLSTLFTTSAGTTPVAIPGLGSAVSVGLMLDKSQGLVLGSELLTNGDFSGGTTGWTIGSGGTAAVTSGVIRLTSTTGRSTASQAILTNVGQQYRIDLGLVSNGTGGPGAAIVRVTSTNSYGGTLVAFAGTASSNGFLFFTATTATTYIWLAENSATSGVYVEFGGLSIKADSGNHAISFNNTTARPELRARVNLLERSEEFDNAVWLKPAGTTTINPNQTAAPNGTTTADLVTATAGNACHYIYQVASTSGSITATIYAKAGTANWLGLGSGYTNGTETAWFDLTNGTVGAVASGGSATIVSAGNGWWRCSHTRSSWTAGGILPFITNANNVAAFNAAGTETIYIWGADLRPANIGANVPAYQRIADANTYDTAGFPLYLRFDGVDDSMYTPANLNLSGTDKVAVFAGVRKLSNATGLAIETSSDPEANNGAFLGLGTDSSGFEFFVGSRGTVYRGVEIDNAAYASPFSAVTTAAFDILAPLARLRINSAVASQNINSQGAGNYGTYPLYIGSRNNSIFFFNGHLHSLIIAGSAVSAGNISATEQWVAGKTGLVIP